VREDVRLGVVQRVVEIEDPGGVVFGIGDMQNNLI
jgi:hypothetical protein